MKTHAVIQVLLFLFVDFFCFLSCVICPNFAVSNFSSVQLSNIADPLKSKSDQCAGSG